MSSPTKDQIWGSGSAGDLAGASYNLAASPSLANSDLVFVFALARGATGPVTNLVPSDGTNTYTQLFSQTQNNLRATVYTTKLSSAGAISVVVTPTGFTAPDTTCTVDVVCIALAGADNVSPLDCYAISHGTSVANTTFGPTTTSTPQANTQYNNDFALAAVMYNGNSALTLNGTGGTGFSPACTSVVIETLVSATGARNCSIGLIEGVAGASGSAQSISAQLVGAVGYIMPIIMINGPTSSGTRKRPALSCGMRSPSAPPSNLVPEVNYSIIQARWCICQPGSGTQMNINGSPGGTITPPPASGATAPALDTLAHQVASISASWLAGVNSQLQAVRKYNGIANVGSPTYSSTGGTDPSASSIFWTNNAFAGLPVWAGTKYGVIASSTTAGAFTLTGAGWTGGTPANGTAFIIGPSQRTITDGAITTGTTLTSASAQWTSADQYKYLTGPGIPAGTYIATVTSATVVHTNQACTNASGLTIVIGLTQTLRLRPECGYWAPTWVLQLAGGPIGPFTHGSLGSIKLPLHWTSAVQNAYLGFMMGLANSVLYSGETIDLCPEITECQPALTGMYFPETFIRFPSSTNTPIWQAAGLTTPIDLAAMKTMIDTHIAAFPNTIIHCDANGYQNIDNLAPQGLAFTGNTSGALDLSTSGPIMDYCIGKAPAVQFTNASLSDTGNTSLYAMMQNYGPKGTGDAIRNNKASISFQTMPTVASLPNVLARAIQFGASSTEIPGSPNEADLIPGFAQLVANYPGTPFPWTSGGGATVPGAPTGVTAVAGNASATVNWLTPGNGGSPLTSITIIPRIAGVNQTPITGINPALETFNVTGLTNGTNYDFLVEALNAIGTSSPSSPSNVVTPSSGATAPGTPAAPTVTAQNGSFLVAWVMPSPGTQPITSTTVTLLIGGVAQTPVVVPAPATSVTITAVNGTTYTAECACTSSVGTGGTSAQSGNVTPSVIPGGVVEWGNGSTADVATWPLPSEALVLNNSVFVAVIGHAATTAPTTLTPSDANGNSWQFIVGSTKSSIRTELWWCPEVQFDGASVITITPQVSCTIAASAFMVSLSGTDVIDLLKSANANSTSPAATSIATIFTPEFLIAVLGMSFNPTITTPITFSPLTSPEALGTLRVATGTHACQIQIGWEVTSANQAQSFTAVLGAAQNWVALLSSVTVPGTAPPPSQSSSLTVEYPFGPKLSEVLVPAI